MADDTPTVEQAIDILRRLKTWDMLDWTHDGPYVRERLDAAIALIAAVRAEQDVPITEPLLDWRPAHVDARGVITASTGQPGTVGEHLTSGNAKKTPS